MRTASIAARLVACAGLATAALPFAAGEALAWVRAEGARGGAVAAGPRGAVAVGPNGGTAVARPGYPGYPAYRPPPPVYRPPATVVRPVPVYPAYPSAGAVAGAAAVGAMAGAAVGAAAASQPPPPSTVVVVPSAPPPTTLVVGTTLAVLPAGCGAAQAGGVTYYRCGSAWVRPYMQGSTVAYVVVPPP